MRCVYYSIVLAWKDFGREDLIKVILTMLIYIIIDAAYSNKVSSNMQMYHKQDFALLNCYWD